MLARMAPTPVRMAVTLMPRAMAATTIRTSPLVMTRAACRSPIVISGGSRDSRAELRPIHAPSASASRTAADHAFSRFSNDEARQRPQAVGDGRAKRPHGDEIDDQHDQE